MLRVTLSGVESTGKSTLAQALSDHYKALVVPEFGRTYTERLDRPLTLADHHAIADGHVIAADQCAAANPRLLIEDTDIVMTTAWATMLFGGRDRELADQDSRADLHLLLWPDVPFVADPVRLFADQQARERFHEIILAEFEARALSPVRIDGDWSQRLNKAIQAIEAKL